MLAEFALYFFADRTMTLIMSEALPIAQESKMTKSKILSEGDMVRINPRLMGAELGFAKVKTVYGDTFAKVKWPNGDTASYHQSDLALVDDEEV